MAHRRRKAPDAKDNCPESRLGLPLRDSPPFRSASEDLGCAPRNVLPLWVRSFLKIPFPGHQQVPCSFWPTRGSQRQASRGRTVSAHLSPRAPVLPASGLAIQASPPADGADTRTALGDEFWPWVCGDWAAADGSGGRAAQRRAHRAGRAAPGARSSAHSAFNTMDRVAQSPRAVRRSGSPRGVSPLFSLECPPNASRPSSASLHLASRIPESVLPRCRNCCRHGG